MKNFSLIFILPAAWVAYACSTSSGKDNAIEDPNSVPVAIQPLLKAEQEIEISASGQFTTNEETYLSFKTGGVIAKILVKEGDQITKGQLLATLNLTEINAQVTQAKLALEKSKRDYERVANLYRDSVATLEQFQNSKTGLEMATQQYATAEFNRSYSEIRALEDGQVLRKFASEGQVVSTGTYVLQTNSGKNGDWVLKAGVNDRDWSRLAVGDKATVKVDAADATLGAEVVRKSASADPLSGTFTVELRISQKPSVRLATGLFGKATIYPSSAFKAWAIPFDALLDGDGQKGFVFVTNDGKTAEKRDVTVASIQNNKVIITSGLDDAKSIIISGSAYLRDKSLIRVVNSNQ